MKHIYGPKAKINNKKDHTSFSASRETYLWAKSKDQQNILRKISFQDMKSQTTLTFLQLFLTDTKVFDTHTLLIMLIQMSSFNALIRDENLVRSKPSITKVQDGKAYFAG